MNLTIDIGNTRTKWALMEAGEIRANGTQPSGTPLSLPNTEVDAAIVCVTGNISSEMLQLPTPHTYHLSASTPLPIALRYESPETLGPDRIAAACGAWRILPKGTSALIVDAGTCITVDYLDAQGCYCGGAIMPGLEMKFRALHTFTAKLPLLTLSDAADNVVTGGTTQQSISAGVITASRFAIAGFARHYLQKDSKLQLIFTGGDGALLMAGRELQGLQCQLVPELVMIGLDAIAEKITNEIY